MTVVPDVGGLVMLLFYTEGGFFILGVALIKLFLFFCKRHCENLKKLRLYLFSYSLVCVLFYCLFDYLFIKFFKFFYDTLGFYPVLSYQSFIKGILGLIFFIESNRKAFLYTLIAYIILDGFTMIHMFYMPVTIFSLPFLPFYYWYVIKQANKFKAQHAKV